MDSNHTAKPAKNDNGDAMTIKRDAEEAGTRFRAPFVVGSEISALGSIDGKLEGCKKSARFADFGFSHALTRAVGWRLAPELREPSGTIRHKTRLNLPKESTG
jgi:hypothetical protein